jgi:DNA replication protein DnaC
MAEINGLEMIKNIDNLLMTVNPCPVCGSLMAKWIDKRPNGEERCAPICPLCGHAEVAKRNRELSAQKVVQSKRSNAIAKMKNISMVQDTTIWTNTFDNYLPMDNETSLADEKARYWSKELLSGDRFHAVLIGKPGAGKTHLALSIVNYVVKNSNYEKSCAVISYQYLYDQIRLYMTDSKARMAIQGTVLDEIAKCDLVVIDDLGAELGRIEDNTQATEFNVSLITSIVEKRANRATIFTSNLTAKQLKHAYGERVFSRIMNNANANHVMNFTKTTDKRMNGFK